MRIFELRSEQEFRKVISGMNRIGITGLLDFEYQFEPVKGAVGGFGSIMSHPRLNYVIKLFDIEDTGYLKFVQVALDNSGNPHFPKFRGRPMKLSNQTMGVRMERLQKWPRSKFETIEMLLNQAQRDSNWRRHLDSNPLAQEFIHTWPQFGDALDSLNSAALSKHSDVEFDWHDGNIMQRTDGTPVIVDPFAPAY